ncbi:NUDIX domain-containing protein [Gleimia sp. 6138-11-ORH1]|uniref:(deoxy)nucleoside triphosphate pyrophosphohydrolase n=1 Tax=Gleimia sp. 6138-11-ORH1 TaxID=2973937 RepID=UPI00216A0C6F|nr:NUDIX domain-containing protein [Gleimia sp. 6138-11-ORH1]MCS4484718.1 NUDIX domain-containing protein [Gleimia sp. 6138-11-ORH1]
MSEMKRPVVAAAIFDTCATQPKILCAQRAYPEALRGKWELPGGKAELGESLEAALQREISEELGAQIVLHEPVLSSLLPQGAWPILQGRVMYVWLATIVSGGNPPQALEDHLQVRWCTLAQARELEWLAPNISIMEAAFSLLQEKRFQR